MQRPATNDDETVTGTPPRRRGCLWGLLAVVAMSAVLVAATIWGWRSRDEGHVRQWEELAALPEASLYYPGAVQLGAGGNDYDVGILSRLEAGYSQRISVDASMDEVRAFYARELPKRGWEPSCGYGPGCVGGGGWRRDQLYLPVAPDSKANDTAYRTVYIFRINVSPIIPTATAVR